MTDGFRKKPEGLKDPEIYDFKMFNDPLKKVYFAIVDLLKKEPQPPPTY